MMKRIYFDYAASTPVDPRVERAMRPYFSKIYGNPGSVHMFGQDAARAVFLAREKVAKALGAKYDEIIFTGSATEANNLVLRSFPQIITSAIEHESIMETCKNNATYLPVNKEGIVDLKKLKDSLNEQVTLVSVGYVNSVIGTVQPIKEIGEIIKSFRKDKKYPLFHTDAVQALQYLNCNVEELGVDLMTISAHKIYAPKGVGVLYVKERCKSLLRSLITGGGQEFGLRSATENVPGIVGFGKAVELVENLKLKEFKRVRSLRDYFGKELQKIVPDARLNGSLEKRVPNNLNIYFPGRSAQDLAIELDLNGIAVSPGTACSAHTTQASYVISALGYSGDRPYSSLRFSFGRQTTKDEIKRALAIFQKRFTKK